MSKIKIIIFIIKLPAGLRCHAHEGVTGLAEVDIEDEELLERHTPLKLAVVSTVGVAETARCQMGFYAVAPVAEGGADGKDVAGSCHHVSIFQFVMQR